LLNKRLPAERVIFNQAKPVGKTRSVVVYHELLGFVRSAEF
jgi:hypothetical protein